MENQRRDQDSQVDEQGACGKTLAFEPTSSREALSRLKKTPVQKRPMSLMRYLVYLLIVTTTVTGVSLSKYSASSSTDDSARVAKFNVAVAPIGWANNGVVAHGITVSNTACILRVTNNGEVAVRARLVISSAPAGAVSSINPAAIGRTDISAWFDLAIGGTQDITVNIVGDADGNAVAMYVEYEQVD